MYTNYLDVYSSYLLHSGKKGMKWGVRRREKKIEKAKQYWDKVKKYETKISINPNSLSKRMDKDWKNNNWQITKEINRKNRSDKAAVMLGMSAIAAAAVTYVSDAMSNKKAMYIGATILAGSLGGFAIADYKSHNNKFVKRIKNHRESAHYEKYKKLSATRRQYADKLLESVKALDKYVY